MRTGPETEKEVRYGNGTQHQELVVFRETIRSEGGCELEKPLRKCAAAAVIKNPYAGAYQEDLTLLMEYGEYLGGYLTQKAVEAMGIDPSEVHSFGKACIVGLDGEHEHAAALMHPRLGAPMRAYLGAGKAVIPSAKKIAAPGATLDVRCSTRTRCSCAPTTTRSPSASPTRPTPTRSSSPSRSRRAAGPTRASAAFRRKGSRDRMGSIRAERA